MHRHRFGEASRLEYTRMPGLDHFEIVHWGFSLWKKRGISETGVHAISRFLSPQATLTPVESLRVGI